jgi:hypothetical protein
VTATVIPLLPKKDRRSYVRVSAAVRAHVIRLRGQKKGYREISARAGVSIGSVGKILTHPMAIREAEDVAKRNGLDRHSIRERQQDILVARLAETVHGALDLAHAAIEAGDARGFALAMQGIERLSRVLDRGAGPARVASSQAPPVPFDVLLSEIREKYDPSAMPKVS